ncbi:DUF6160 family protein [Pseudomonas citronellolis]|uniref:DUF6160 family protein n=1 Tax=Pseudomonas citronellolis TaxID=53408 RepID=UPI0022BA326C|nr:DUF6160 family protein [Pseudomonas citronellolis]WBG63803.1 hypothetical protein ELR50_13350 [Pseudomonas citronellolis]
MSFPPLLPPRRRLRAAAVALLAMLTGPLAQAELRTLPDDDLGQVVGQDGLSLGVTVNIQKTPSITRCPGGCGARVAIQPAGSGNNFLVLDNISGTFSFDEVTVDILSINSGFGGDGAAFNRQVLRVGLKDVNFDGISLTLAGANKARSTDAGLVQTDLLSARVDGVLHVQGNLNLFQVPAR